MRIGPGASRQKWLSHTQQHALLTDCINTMEKFDAESIEDTLETENDLHGKLMNDEQFDRATDDIYASVDAFERNIKELDRLLVLYHVIADKRAVVWYPPRKNGEVLEDRYIEPDRMEPFNYIIHTYRERELAPGKNIRHGANPVLFNTEAVKSLRKTATRHAEYFCLGELTDLDRHHFKQICINLGALSEKLEPYLNREGIDTKALELLLRQENFQLFERNQSKTRFES